MILKIFKAVWFLSMLAAVAVLLYAYASYPEAVQLTSSDSPEGAAVISREGLFYTALAALGLINALVFVVGRLMAPKDELFQAWFLGLIIFFNLFGVVVLEFLNLFNSNERFDYSSIGFIIYGSVALIVVWASLWPLARFLKSPTANQPIVNK